MKNFLSRTLALSVMLLSSLTIESRADDFLSVKFSKKNLVKTSMTWIQFKPKLVLAPRLIGTAGLTLSHPDLSEPADAVNIAATSPYAQVGKLLFTLGDVTERVSSCSAVLIGDGGTVMTAAHCVMSLNGNWNDNFIFVRSYGSKQQDIYAVKCIALLEDWGTIIGENVLNFDYAFIKVNRISTSGGLQLSIDSPPEKLKIIGYSDNHRKGRQMLILDIEPAITSSFLSYQNNPLGKGSSGSPWLGGASNAVYTVTSHLLKPNKAVMKGPRLTPVAERLLAYTKNGCD